MNKDSNFPFPLPEKADLIRTLVHSDFYTEGPVIDENGNFFFTTLAGGKIMKIDRDRTVSVWAETSCPNGQRILSNGSHLVCDSEEGKVVRFNASGKRVEDIACGEIEGVSIRTPNDLVVDEGTGFYFTDSVRHSGAVYFIGNDGSKSLVASNLDYPNGICLSRNKTKLFIAESYQNRILVVELKAPGVSGSAPEVFCELPWNTENTETGNLPDGIIMDNIGRIWVAHYGMQAVHVIFPQGEIIASYDTGIPLTSNLCFTKEKNGIIVTGGTGEPGPGKINRLSFKTANNP